MRIKYVSVAYFQTAVGMSFSLPTYHFTLRAAFRRRKSWHYRYSLRRVLVRICCYDAVLDHVEIKEYAPPPKNWPLPDKPPRRFGLLEHITFAGFLAIAIGFLADGHDFMYVYLAIIWLSAVILLDIVLLVIKRPKTPNLPR